MRRGLQGNEDAKSQLFELKKQMTKANLEAGRSGLNGSQGGANLSFASPVMGPPRGQG